MHQRMRHGGIVSVATVLTTDRTVSETECESKAMDRKAKALRCPKMRLAGSSEDFLLWASMTHLRLVCDDCNATPHLPCKEMQRTCLAMQLTDTRVYFALNA